MIYEFNMFEQISFEDFHNLFLAHKNVAVYKKFSADMLTPMAALSAIEEETPMLCFAKVEFEPLKPIAGILLT